MSHAVLAKHRYHILAIEPVRHPCRLRILRNLRRIERIQRRRQLHQHLCRLAPRRTALAPALIPMMAGFRFGCAALLGAAGLGVTVFGIDCDVSAPHRSANGLASGGAISDGESSIAGSIVRSVIAASIAATSSE